jgi:hypothetical protein
MAKDEKFVLPTLLPELGLVCSLLRLEELA